jgi:hypothetical protein
MSRKVFTAGEVLAAADVNSFLMDQTVMSFAGTAARGSAIPTPVNGMTTYLEDSKALQVYDGSAYIGVGGLTHINTQTFSGVSSVSFPNNSFTSQFDVYQIIFVQENASPNTNVTFRLRSGTDNSTSNYTLIALDAFPTASSVVVGTGTGITLYPGSRTRSLVKLLVANPNKSAPTQIQCDAAPFFTTVEPNIRFAYGNFIQNTVFDSCSFIPAEGNFSGYVQLYGLRK